MRHSTALISVENPSSSSFSGALRSGTASGGLVFMVTGAPVDGEDPLLEG